MKLSDESREELRNDYRLSPREVELLELVLEGIDTNAQLARRMGIATGTVKQYLHVLYAKFRVNSKVGLIIAVCETSAAFTEI